MMRAVKPPPNLPDLVKSTFAKARADGELHYFPTQATLLPVGPVNFQLRFSPTLANKPKSQPPPSSSSSSTGSHPPKPVDPFAHPPASLYISALGPSHFLVLNKFAVVPEHFILATTAFEEQTHLLAASDLDATLSCIQAYEQQQAGGGGLFAFFNSGHHSGASQPHRHIQLLPVSCMKDNLDPTGDDDDGSGWDVLIDQAGFERALPFVVFKEQISLDMSAAELHGAYTRLYRQACRAVDHSDHVSSPARTDDDGDDDDDHGGRGGEGDAGPPHDGPAARLSYNMAMTKTTLALCPRLAEGAPIHDGQGKCVGALALNGTVLAGTALVKNEAEWEALRRDPASVRDVLRRIGVPRT